MLLRRAAPVVLLTLAACTSTSKTPPAAQSPSTTTTSSTTTTTNAPPTSLVHVPSSAPPCSADNFGPSAGGFGSAVTGGGASVFIDLPVLQTCSFNTVPAIAIRDNNDTVVTRADGHQLHDTTAPERDFVVVTPESGATLFGEWRYVCTRPTTPLTFAVTFPDGSSLDAPLEPDEFHTDFVAPTCFVNGAPSDPTLPTPSGTLVITVGTKVPVAPS